MLFRSCSVAIGLAILSKGGNFSKYSSILVGDVLSITKTEIVYLKMCIRDRLKDQVRPEATTRIQSSLVLEQIAKAVSYTHLDVYKRQVFTGI